MDYSAVSQAAKRFEQESKVSHKIGEIKKKTIAALRDNWISTVETWTQNLVKFITNINLELIIKNLYFFIKKKRIFKDFIEY